LFRLVCHAPGAPPFSTKNSKWFISDRAKEIVHNLSAADVALCPSRSLRTAP
jgi:hypothetical protein